ncbi:TetR/AcrR family transcriptional regulator [Glaciecola sp. MH2013]|uniref:TetR/AcrR family transcriptional regulator n=1 Tax=Glaciecola sp. MH2013 TaxID=2785524 RepID=UPI0018A02116|nr:TetR/AcrR family transcriptional regulator [Glaciecola sp. MH2013]MBF7073427.1 TetR/AcrR family transcriptional regulator [Glaciecola sp. MH2013]
MAVKQTLTDKKRADIVNAAIAEFDRLGFQKTSMDHIAKTAEVSKRTVYNHFPSKDALFREITNIMWKQGLAATSYEYQSSKTLNDQLSDIAYQEMVLLKTPSFISVSRLIFAECFHTPGAVEAAVEQMGEAESGLVLWLKEAISAKRLNISDVDIASKQFYGMLKSVAFWPQIIGYACYPDEKTVDKLVSSSVSMFLSQYEIQD